MITHAVHVREYGGTYIARCNRKTASSTNSARCAFDEGGGEGERHKTVL